MEIAQEIKQDTTRLGRAGALCQLRTGPLSMFSDSRGLLHLFLGVLGADNPGWAQGQIFGRSLWDWLSQIYIMDKGAPAGTTHDTGVPVLQHQLQVQRLGSGAAMAFIGFRSSSC